MVLRILLITCLLLIPYVFGEKVEGTAIDFGQILQLQCLQRDDDGEVLLSMI